MSGWIKLHRKIQESSRYFSQPFCRNMAWVDLLMMANHDDNFFYAHGVRIDVKRGQCGLSIVSLSKRWRWSQGKVKRFLNELANDEQIEQQNSNVTTLITIINYDQYQGDEEQIDSKTVSKRRANGEQTETNKNVKNVKEERGASAPSYKQWSEKQFYDEVAKFAKVYPKNLLREFYDYWREPSPSGMMAFQLKKTWSTGLRLKKWQDREKVMPVRKQQDLVNGAAPLKPLTDVH